METLASLAFYALYLTAVAFPPGKTTFSLAEAPGCPSTAAPCPLRAARRESCFLGGFERLGEKVVPCTSYGGPVRSAWVVPEPWLTGFERLKGPALAIGRASLAHGAEWPEGPRDLARALVVQAGWSTAFREDIQNGRTRGPGGEVCLADVQIRTLRRFAPELDELSDREAASRVVGSGTAELTLCFEVLARGLVHARRYAAWKCKPSAWRQPVEQSAFAVYHTGGECTSRFERERRGWKWNPEQRRFWTLSRFRSM